MVESIQTETEGRTRAALRALAAVFSSPALRRLQLAWIGSILGAWAYIVALGVYAYDQGGPAAVGLVGLIRFLPAAVLAPFTSSLVDRFSRVKVMVWSDVVRAALMIGAAVTIAADGPAPIVYALVAFSAIASTVFRPAKSALLPALVTSPGELTAANAASSTLESVGMFLGPALGGVLLAISSPSVVFAANGLAFVWSAVLVFGLRAYEPARIPIARDASRPVVPTVMAGISTIVHEQALRTLVGLYGAQTLVAGAVNVLVVVAAFRLLDLGEAGVGLLYAALGVGGLIGGFAASTTAFVAVVALGIVGIGNSLVDVNALTIMQRAVPDAVLGRALGALDGLMLATLGLGALLAPVLVDAVGVKAALVATGALLPVLALLTRPRLHAIDSAAAVPEATGLLRGVGLLAVLPEPVLERLALESGAATYPAGATILREGDPGDLFYVVSSGTVTILGKEFGPGEAFGEIALLRDVPRTATATAVTDVSLVTLERGPFVAAVTGHAPSAAEADTLIAARLGSLSARNSSSV